MFPHGCWKLTEGRMCHISGINSHNFLFSSLYSIQFNFFSKEKTKQNTELSTNVFENPNQRKRT